LVTIVNPALNPMGLTVYYKKFLYQLPLIFLCCVASRYASAQAPVANFSATPLSGCAPLAVSFTDLSTGGPYTLQWDLGNGTLSTQANPTTTYLTPGIYTVTLTVSNANGSNTLTRTQYITVNDRPVVNFRASDSVGCFPLRVNFTDLSSSSTGSNTTWDWDFGDGTSSTAQNPFHIYTAAGNYTVTLRVTNSGGCTRVLSKTQYIRVSPGVTVNFNNGAGQQCHPPESIPFTNLSTGPGTLSYQWLFGDGGSSTATSPSHVYSAAGSYSVTLIAQSSLGCVDTLVRNNAVTIRDVQSAFTGPDSVCANQQVLFINTSNPLPTNASVWDFGDGTSSNTPVKAWGTPGVYQVQLINNYGTCTDTVTRPIRVLALPVANFTANDSIDCEAPFTVNFQDLSTGGVSWRWDFGDGGTSTQQNPVHTYTANGQYTVKLVVTNASGCRDSLIKTQYIRIVRPVVNMGGVPVEGCIPYTFVPTANVTAIDGVASYLWDFGDGNTSTAQNPSHVYPNQGTYTVKLLVTTNDGCSDSSIVPFAVRVGSLPVADFTAAPLSQCVGQVVQFTDLSVPADRWLWDFGNLVGSSTAQNPQYSYPDTGVYTIRLTVWNNGCSATVTKPSYVTALPPVARFGTTFNCNNKRQVVFVDQSVLPQSWAWDFGDGNTSTLPNPTHTYTNFGTYQVSLTVTNGSCSHTIIQTVTLVNEIADFNVVEDTVCKNQQTVFVLGLGVNQSNIASYTWHFGDGQVQTTTSPIGANFYANAGVYTVKLVLTDIRGCRDSITKVNMIRVWGPTANFTPSPLLGCRALNVNFADGSTTDGVHPITSWTWYYGDGQVQTLGSGPFGHLYDTAGNFTARLKVRDSFGCTDSIAFATPIFVTDPQARFSSADTLTCVGANVAFANTSTGVNLTYAWNFGNGNTSALVTPPAITYAADGNYTVTLTVTDVNGCIDSLRLTDYIKVRTTDASFAVNDSISSCAPFEVIFTNTSLNRSSQLWDFGDGTTSTLPNPTHYYNTPGTYRVRLLSTGPGGCTDSAFKNIILYPSTATLTYSPLGGCSPLPVNFYLSTPGPVTYLWDFNDGTTVTNTDSILTYNYLLPGNFVPKVILEDQTGCLIPVTGIDTIRVTRSNVKFGISDSLFCDRGTVVFSDSTVSNAAVTNYFWSFGDGGTSTLQNPTHTYNNPGLYTVQLIVRTINGCEDTLIRPSLIKVVASPQIGIGGSLAACEPASLSFLGLLLAADTSALSWQWSFGNGNTDTARNPVAQAYNTAGSYPLQLVVTNSSGCTDTVDTTVVIHPLPTTNAGNDTVLCLGTPLQLNATGASSYVWQPGATLSCTNCASPLSNTATSQWYAVTGSTPFGCTTTDSVFVRVKPGFTLNVSPLTASLCVGQSVQLRATGAENYSWSPATGLSSSTVANPVASPTVSTVYRLVAFDTVGCFSDSALVNITVSPYPTVDAGPDRTIPAGGNTLLSPLYSSDVTSYLWSPATDLSCTTCPSPTATPKSTTTYSVRVSNSGGCTTNDAVTVFVICGNQNVFIPNTFSPNADGANDVFFPRGRGIYQVQSMRIFNRWGEMVFQRTNFTANDPSMGWNGRYRGIAANPDVYTYIIEVICDNSEVIPFKGNITLIQ
jgi:gliding motility-associated-like protein